MTPVCQEYLIPVVGPDMTLPLMAAGSGAKKKLPFVENGRKLAHLSVGQSFEELKASARWLIRLDLHSQENTTIWLAIQNRQWAQSSGLEPSDLVPFRLLPESMDLFGLAEDKIAMLKEVYGQVFFKTAYGTLRCQLTGEML